MALKTLLLLRPPLQLLKEGQRRKRVSLVLENQRNQDLLLVLHLILPLLLHLERKGGRDVVEGRVVLHPHPLDPVLLDLLLERRGARDVEGGRVILLHPQDHPLDPVLLDLLHPRLRHEGPHAGRLGQSAALLVAPRVPPRKPLPHPRMVSVTRSAVSMTGRTRSGASTLTSASATVAAR